MPQKTLDGYAMGGGSTLRQRSGTKRSPQALPIAYRLAQQQLTVSEQTRTPK